MIYTQVDSGKKVEAVAEVKKGDAKKGAKK